MPNTEPDGPSCDYTERELQLLQSLEEADLPKELPEEILNSIPSLAQRRQSNRARILSSLEGTKLSKKVQDYLARLKAGSLRRDEDTFIEGVQQAAGYLNLNATERAQHFGHELKGIYYSSTFTASWNRLFPEQRIAWWEPEATRCCAKNWSHVVENGSWELVHQRAGYFCQGMIEIFLGPTTLDCGMALQYLIYMGFLWMFGEVNSDKVFPGHLAFVKSIFKVHVDRLYPFYDHARFRYGEAAETPSCRVLLKTVYNDAAYMTQRPGGDERLYNCIVVDGVYIVFHQRGPKTLFTRAELEDLLRQGFNAPRDEADRAQIRRYARSSNGRVIMEVQAHQHLELSGDAWTTRENDRTPDVTYTLRVDRIIQCATEVLKAPSTSKEPDDVFSHAWQLYRETAERSVQILDMQLHLVNST